MFNTRAFVWAIASLLLHNLIGIVIILVQVIEPNQETFKTEVTDLLKEADSINKIEPVLEETHDSPVQVRAYIEPMDTNATEPETLPASPAVTEIIIARVNDSDISQALLISYLNQYAPPENLAQWNSLNDVPQDLLMRSINNAALDKLLVQQAIEMKFDQHPVIKAAIAKSNRNILKSAFLDQLAPGLVSSKNVEVQYKTLVASLEGKLEYRARHILLANEKEAKIVEKALEQNKKPFDELAKLFSLDEPTGLRGGDLGYVLSGQLNPKFEKEISNLEVGQRSQPFETELGWHIAILDDRRDSQPMTLNQATPVIRDKLEQQAIQNYLSDLLSSATIEILIAAGASEENLSSIDMGSSDTGSSK